MESLRAAPGAVMEADIFAALSPRTHAAYRRPEPQRPRSSSSPPTAGGVILPRVGPSRSDSPRSSGDKLFEPKVETMLPPKTPRSLMTSIPISVNECLVVWRFLCDWVTAQLAMEAPAAIPGFGTIVLKTQPTQHRVAVFEPERAFQDKFALQTTDATRNFTHPRLVTDGGASLPSGKQSCQSPPVLRKRQLATTQSAPQQGAFSFMEMAACCSFTPAIDAAKAQEWLQAVVQKIGEAMNECKRIELNLRVGVLTCTDATIESQLVSHHSIVATKTSTVRQPRLAEDVSGQSLLPVGSHQGQQQSHTTATVPSPACSTMARSSFLTSRDFPPTIQLYPVIPIGNVEYSLRPPRRPSSFGARGNNTSSPRSQPLTAQQTHTQRGLDSLEIEATLTLRCDEDFPSVPQSDHSGNLIKTTPLFDSLSRTLCVEPENDKSILLPSNRIGANFSEAAKKLAAVNTSGANKADSAKLGLAFVAPDTLRSETMCKSKPNLPHEAERSEARYFECLRTDGFIDLKCIAPLSLAIERRVVASAIKYLPATRMSSRLEDVLNGEQRQMTENYFSSIKQAILNYLLLRRETRERFGIAHGIPIHAMLPVRWKWGDSAGENGCVPDLKVLAPIPRGDGAKRMTKQQRMHTWSFETVARRRAELETIQVARKKRRKRLEAKLTAHLLLTDARVQRLQALWLDLESSVSLVSSPSPEALKADTPTLELVTFVREQLQNATRVKTQLMSSWHDKARSILTLSAPNCVDDTPSSRHLMDTVATLMSIQLRSVVEKSIERYLAFFEQFSTESVPIHGSGLLVTLMQHAETGTTDFRDPLHGIPSYFLSVLHHLLKLFDNIPRIEALDDETKAKKVLWRVTSHEEIVVSATIRIRTIVEQHLGRLHDLQALYQSFAVQLQQIVRSSLNNERSPPLQCYPSNANLLWSFRDAMRRADATVRSMLVQITDVKHLNLFVVDCRDVNASLRAQYMQWTAESLAAFQDRTSSETADLLRAYKDVAVRLARRPANLDELLEFEAFVSSLKKTRVIELQDEAKIIKEHIRYLLYEREVVHVDADQLETSVGQTMSVESRFSVSHNLLEAAAKASKWHVRLATLIRETDITMVGERARIEASFLARRTLLLAEIDEFESEVHALATKGDLRHSATSVVQLGKMKEALAVFRRNAEAVAADELRLQWAITDFGKLDDIAGAIEPYDQLWRTTSFGRNRMPAL